MTRHLLVSALCLGLVIAAGSPGRAQKPSKDDLVLAKVNGEEITRRQLVNRLLQQRGDESLEKMINRVLLQQEAKKHNLSVSDEEVDRRLKELQGRFRNDDYYHAFLTQSQLTEGQFKEEIRNTLLLQKVALRANPIADAELEQFDARIIVTPDRAIAEKWIHELDGGADFIRLAAERNQDPPLRMAEGRLQPFLKIEMLDIWRAIDGQKLKPGAYTKTPVKLSDSRWGIIRFERRMPVEETASAAERDRLLATVTAFHCDQWVNDIRKSAAVTRAKSLDEPVVATVNGEPISREQLASRLLEYSGEDALQKMVNRTLLLQAAKDANVSVSQEEGDKLFQETRSKLPTPEAFQTFLTRSNMTEQQLRDEIRYRALMERVALKESPITDEDLAQYTIRLLDVPTQSDAEDAIKALNDGQDFGKVVALLSDDEEAKASGGLMAPFVKVDMLDVWRVIEAQKLKPGEYTKKPALMTNNHYIVVKLESITPSAEASPSLKKGLEARITGYRVEQWLSQARLRAKFEYPVPLSLAK
jgi:foldase protein PrsA